jgi:excisionase family DNA binding protein
LSVADAAKTHHVPAATLRRWISEGRLTSLEAGGRRWLRDVEVEQLMEWRTARAT